MHNSTFAMAAIASRLFSCLAHLSSFSLHNVTGARGQRRWWGGAAALPAHVNPPQGVGFLGRGRIWCILAEKSGIW